MISIENLSKVYETKSAKVPVFAALDLEVASGEFLTLTGRSGGGKTTLLSIMGGLSRPTSGKVLIDGIDLWALAEPELALMRNRKFGFVFQFASLIPTLKVIDNVLLPISFAQRRPTLEDREKARHLLEVVGIPEKDGAFPHQLSGGQQRRVAIARALINDPAILFADEPTGDLDEETERAIMELLRDINAQGTTIVLVTHALDYALIGSRALTLRNGSLVPFEGEGHTA